MSFSFCGKDFSEHQNVVLTLLNFVFSSRHKESKKKKFIVNSNSTKDTKEGFKKENMVEYLNKISQANEMDNAEIKMRRGHKVRHCEEM